jgi:hypothetical protein
LPKTLTPKAVEGDSLAEAPAMIEELQNFRIKFTRAGNDTYEAWRESDHDDLVLAAAMAAWFGEKKLHTILKPPPPADGAG